VNHFFCANLCHRKELKMNQTSKATIRFKLTLTVILLLGGAWTAGLTQELTAGILSTQVICRQAGRYIGWPTIMRTQDDELVAVFSGDRDAHICPWGKTQMIRSRDGGVSWSDPMTVNNTPLDDRDAGILQSARGTWIVSWFTSVYFIYAYEKDPQKWPQEMTRSWPRHIEKLSPAVREQWLGNWIRRSDDGGQTWGNNIRTPVSTPHGPIRLRDGRLLYVGINKIIGDEKDPEPPDKERLAAAESRDDGKTWTIIGFIPVPENLDPGAKGFHEAHAVETSGGAIIALLRHHGTPGKYYLWQSESADGGKTWSEAHQTPIWGYPPHLIRLQNGWLLVTYGRRKEPFGERACISRNGGKTWEVDSEFTVADAPNGDLGYPATVQLKDGSLYSVYYQVDHLEEPTCLMGTHWRIKGMK
jgi:sialidase-1